MKSLRRTALFLGLVSLALPTAHADDAGRREIVQQQEEQRRVQAETTQTANRIATMVRVLAYHQLDKNAEKRLLDEAAATLSGLGREQMTQVLNHLDAAVQAPDGEAEQRELTAAYVRHREVLNGLKGLLVKYDALKNLEEAAQRLDRAARSQLDMHLACAQVLRALVNPSDADPSRRKDRSLHQELLREADNQSDVRRDVVNVFTQLTTLKAKLSAPEQDRVRQAEDVCSREKVADGMAKAADNLRATGYPDNRNRRYQEGADLQFKAAGQLRLLARLLRAEKDRLVVLREARSRMDAAMNEQEALKKATDARPDAATTRGMESWQAQATHEITDIGHLLRRSETDLAERLDVAAEAMTDARQALRKGKAPEAAAAQEDALDQLHAAARVLDQMIAKAEQARTDPLAALKQAAETVDKLLAEQKDVRKQTEQAKDRPPEPLAGKQKDLAKRTDDLKEQPLATKPDAQAALDQAKQAMDKAAKSLDQRKGADALPKQDKAIAALEEAKKQIEDKVAEIEKRREEIAKLEEAAKKLGELAKQENKVAEQAKEMPKPGDAKAAMDLAAKQGELTPPTREVGKEIESAAPKAAEKVAEAAKSMDAARSDLQKNEPMPASKQAADAAQKLMDAQKALAQAIDEKKGMEIADQAAMQPGTVNPMNAAQQIAKAIEQAQQAAAAAQQAAKPLGQQPMAPAQAPMPGQPSLAQLQQQVAQQAEKLNLPDAAERAMEAAAALQQMDIAAAIPQQKQALAQLQQAAQAQAGQPMKGEPMPGQPMKGEPMPGQPMKGEPMPGQPMKGEPMPGQPMKGQGQPMKGEPMQGEPMPGQPMKGEPMPGQGQPMKGEPMPGQPMKGQGQPMPGQGTPMPAAAQNAQQLAQAQQALLEATQALAKSQAANNAAMAALAQGQAQAPPAVQGQLGQAQQSLAQAGQNLAQGAPMPAAQGQMQAAAQLAAALQTLNAAASAMGQPGAQPGQPSTALASAQPAPGQGQQPGMGQGQQPGMGQGQQPGMGQGQQPGMSQERNQAQGSGQRVPDGKVNNAASQLTDAKGDGAFIGLQQRQREMIRQALSEKLPPEYAALIQQYFVNIAKGKPASPAPTPERR